MVKLRLSRLHRLENGGRHWNRNRRSPRFGLEAALLFSSLLDQLFGHPAAWMRQHSAGLLDQAFTACGRQTSRLFGDDDGDLCSWPKV